MEVFTGAATIGRVMEILGRKRNNQVSLSRKGKKKMLGQERKKARKEKEKSFSPVLFTN